MCVQYNPKWIIYCFAAFCWSKSNIVSFSHLNELLSTSYIALKFSSKTLHIQNLCLSWIRNLNFQYLKCNVYKELYLISFAFNFIINNSVNPWQVVEVLTDSLTLKETQIPTKVARLMLVSDILHNSSAPVKNASAYRTKFETSLPDIMESFNELYRSITGRITAEALKVRFFLAAQRDIPWFLKLNLL